MGSVFLACGRVYNVGVSRGTHRPRSGRSERRTAPILPAILLAVTCLSARAQDVATLKVEGRGVEGRPAYRGGGVVKFLNISLGAQVIHYQPGEVPPWPRVATGGQR